MPTNRPVATETLQPSTDVAETASVLDRASEWTGLSPVHLEGLLTTFIILLLLIVIRLVMLRILRPHMEEAQRHYRWRRTVNYIFGILAIVLVGRVWLSGLEGIGVVFGLASAGIAIALRDPIVCLVGWLFILIRRPFVVGDRIEVNGKIGDVIDIRMFQTYLVECGEWVDGDQSTGRIVLFPNNMVFAHAIANYTHGFQFIWDELQVRITFESDWRRAKELLTTIVNQQVGSHGEEARGQIKRVADRHMILFQKLTPIVYTQVKEWGVQFNVRYLTPVRQRRASAQLIWESVLDAFSNESHIRFAYPTTRFHTDPPRERTAVPDAATEGT